MRIGLFCVFDAILGRYNEPFNARSVERAKSMFTQVANNPESDICRYPDEYTLFHIGWYNMETGLPEPLQAPQTLGTALSFKAVNETPSDGPQLHQTPQEG